MHTGTCISVEKCRLVWHGWRHVEFPMLSTSPPKNVKRCPYATWSINRLHRVRKSIDHVGKEIGLRVGLRYKIRKKLLPARIELATFRLWDWRSTNWAIGAILYTMSNTYSMDHSFRNISWQNRLHTAVGAIFITVSILQIATIFFSRYNRSRSQSQPPILSSK